MITTLIDKQDTFEIVRDKIAVILREETVEQMNLATAAGKDPADWDLKIYIERFNPWEQFLNDAPATRASTTPIVNVWYDSSNFDKGPSDTFAEQDCTGTFNIDVYGFGRATANQAGGQNPGDKAAALNAQHGVRLVRNILMASVYNVLGFEQPQRVIGQRWVQNITAFQPEQGSQPVQNVSALRIIFAVRFTEFSPQYEAVDLEIVGVEVLKTPEGEVLAEAEYDYTT
jgi:hypothetical protein